MLVIKINLIKHFSFHTYDFCPISLLLTTSENHDLNISFLCLLFLPLFLYCRFSIFLFFFLWLIFRSSSPKWKHLKYTKHRESEWWTRNFFINKSAAVVNININLFIIVLCFDLLPCIIYIMFRNSHYVVKNNFFIYFLFNIYSIPCSFSSAHLSKLFKEFKQFQISLKSLKTFFFFILLIFHLFY